MFDRHRRASLWPAFLLALAAVLAVVVGLPMAESSLSGKVTNSTDTAGTVGLFTCTAAIQAGNGSTAAYLGYPFSETTGLTAADVSGNGRTGSYSVLGVTYGASGPCPRDTARAITLNGSSGSVSGPATTVSPSVFSIEIWFKTTVAGGKLIGLGSSLTGSSGSYDRHLYINTSGNVVFGVYPNAVKTVASTAAYTDGKWHNAIATLAPSTDPNPGMRLYVDGALVASDATTTTAQAFSGYWRIGYDNLASWPNVATNYYFTGSLAFASVYSYALTPAIIAAHYRAGT